MTSILRSAVCLGAFLLAASAVPAHAQTSIRWKLTKGQRLDIVAKQDTTVTTTVNGKDQTATLDMTMELAWQVDSVDESGVATMTQEFTRLSLKSAAPGAEPISYDSASPARPSRAATEIAAGVKPLIGAKFTVTMDARGDVKSVKLTPEAEKALADLPEKSRLKEMLSPQKLTELLRVAGGLLPEKPVSAGDTWNATSETETPYGKLAQETKYTYQPPAAENQSMHTIAFTSTAKLAPKADAEIQLDIKEQTKTGNILFDTAAGLLSSAKTALVSKSVRPFRDTKIEVNVTATTEASAKSIK